MFDPQLVETFLTVVSTRSFTRAAELLGVQQSTVSQQLRRLERAVGRVLMDRDTHSVLLTSDGEAFLPVARRIVDAYDDVADFVSAPQLRGRLRIGISEDFVLRRLGAALRQFTREYPHVELEIAIELSGVLHRRLDDGQLDLILAKRQPRSTRGTHVFTDELVWIGAGDWSLTPDATVPLVLYPPPSITREVALSRMHQSGLNYAVAVTAGSLSGISTAVGAGLGIAPYPASLVPDGVRIVRDRRLPALGDTDFILLTRRSRGNALTEAMTRAIRSAVDGSGAPRR